MRKLLALLATLSVLLVLLVVPGLAQDQPDSDGDGVPDAVDQCPDLSAPGGGLNMTGCPPEVFATAIPAPGTEGLGQGGAYQYPYDYGYGYGYGYGQPTYPPGECAGSLPTQLVVGQQGQIAERFSTLRYYPAGPAIRVMYSPATFTVLDGPLCAGYGPLAWYLLDYGDGLIGWASESQVWSIYGNNRYWLEPFGIVP